MDLIQRDKEYIWHPFTQMKNALPMVGIDRAEKEFLFTTDGRKIIDGVSSWWVNIHGHAHPHIGIRISEQLQKLEHVIFAGFTHEPAVTLVEKLISNYFTGLFSKGFFSDNGSTAVEVALKLAMQFHTNQSGPPKKPRTIIAFDGAYHGDTFGAMAVGERGVFHKAFEPYMFDVTFLPKAIHTNEEEITEKLNQILEDSDVAAIIYEPLLQGAGGMNVLDKKVQDAVLKRCKNAGALLIADEILTGFGRTGTMFATDQMQTKPDLMCLSKGLTGGFMALGLTMVSQDIYDAFLSDDHSKTFFHGHSFTANPIACTAALASLEVFAEDNTLDNIHRIQKSHQQRLAEWKNQGLKNAANLRQLGTLLALDYESDGEGYFSGIRDHLYLQFLEQDLLLRPLGNVVYILPPYCTNEDSLTKLYSGIEDIFNKDGDF